MGGGDGTHTRMSGDRREAALTRLIASWLAAPKPTKQAAAGSASVAGAPKPKAKTAKATTTATSSSKATTSMADDLAGMNLDKTDGEDEQAASLPLPKMTMERSAILKEVREQEKDGKGGSISLVVIGKSARVLDKARLALTRVVCVSLF